LLKGGVLPDGTRCRHRASEATDDRRHCSRIDAEAGEVIDVSGDLVSPPFVDPHFHMDATLSYGQPRINASGTLLEGIGAVGRTQAAADP
jgi:cytosine deaminase